jgi:hypothetical protein
MGGNLRARAGSQFLISMSKGGGLSACVAPDIAAEEMHNAREQPINALPGRSKLVKEIRCMSSW